jgi:hypothetical protein
MAFNATGEDFNVKKHGNAIITGVLTGLAAGAAVSLTMLKELDPAQYFVILIGVVTSGAGIDTLRSKLSKMIANRKAEESEPTSNNTTTTRTTTAPP